MDKIIYLRNVPSYINSEAGEREPVKIEFDVAEDMNISEFKISCIRLAQALGYSSQHIEEEFGVISDKIKHKNLLHG